MTSTVSTREKAWWGQEADQVVGELGTDVTQGLAHAEARRDGLPLLKHADSEHSLKCAFVLRIW